MNEASKTWKIMTDEERSWFVGTVLDIGCGPDKIVPHAKGFDYGRKPDHQHADEHREPKLSARDIQQARACSMRQRIGDDHQSPRKCRISHGVGGPR